MNLSYSIILILPSLMEVLGIIKQSVVYDASGEIIRREISAESEVKKCYRYTWMGPVTETTNQTENCNDFEDDETRPCFEPLVWTFNDEFGNNEPDLGELEEACSEKGCDPFCTPSPSQSCVKYSEWSGNTLTYVSKVTTRTTNISNLIYHRVVLFSVLREGQSGLEQRQGRCQQMLQRGKLRVLLLPSEHEVSL